MPVEYTSMKGHSLLRNIFNCNLLKNHIKSTLLLKKVVRIATHTGEFFRHPVYNEPSMGKRNKCLRLAGESLLG